MLNKARYEELEKHKHESENDSIIRLSERIQTDWENNQNELENYRRIKELFGKLDILTTYFSNFDTDYFLPFYESEVYRESSLLKIYNYCKKTNSNATDIVIEAYESIDNKISSLEEDKKFLQELANEYGVKLQ